MAENHRKSCRVHWGAQLVLLVLQVCLVAIQGCEAVVKLVNEL